MAKKQKRYFLLYPGNKRFYGEGGTLLEKMNQNSDEAWKNATKGENLGNTLGAVGSGISGIASGIMDAYDKTSAIDDTAIEQYQDNIEELDNTNFSQNDSYDSLLDQWQGIDFQKTDWSGTDFRQSAASATGQAMSGIGQATMSGASTGAQVGGAWRAIIGGAAGLLGSTGAAIGGYQNARKESDAAAARLNREAEEANTKAINNMNRQASAITDASYQNMRQNIMAEGGKIHIKPKNRGKFTALKKRTGKSASWFKKHGTPAQRKMATFALNARKWKHDDGGDLYTPSKFILDASPAFYLNPNRIKAKGGKLFTNGVITVNNGGTHEENPYEGVPMGIAPDGLPNLVEEGETIYNDYVFSNRIKAPKELKKRFKLTGSTFSDIAKSAQKESEERPNDPISKRGLDDIMNKLQIAQEAIKQIEQDKQMRRYAKGGKIAHKFDGEGSSILNKGLLTLNPKPVVPSYIQGGIPYFNPYRNSALNITPLDVYEPTREELIARYNWENSGDRPLMRAINEGAKKYEGKSDTTDKKDKTNILPTWMRYAAAAGPAIGAIASLATPPDYSNADILQNAANNLSAPRVRFRPINNYLTYRPIDRNYQLNELRSQAGATRRGIMNSGSNAGQTIAGLLAADYNAQRGIGDALTKMEMYNEQNRQRVADFNRQTNMYNSQDNMQASQANAGLAQRRDQLKAGLLGQVAQMREATDTARLNSIYGNTNGIFENLGNIGSENFAFNQINSNNAWRYGYGLPQTGGLNYTGAKGGKLLTKRRRKH